MSDSVVLSQESKNGRVRCQHVVHREDGERQCRNYSTPGRDRCRIHGGNVPRGIGSPAFRHGRYSKCLPEKLIPRYMEALTNENSLSLIDEIALIETRTAELLSSVTPAQHIWDKMIECYAKVTEAFEDGDAQMTDLYLKSLGQLLRTGNDLPKLWTDILGTVEQRRKLVETQRKFDLQEESVVTLEGVMVLMAAVLDAINRHVASDKERRLVGEAIRGIMHSSRDSG